MYHTDLPWQVAQIKADWGRGLDQHGLQPALGLGALGRDRQRLLGLWLEAEIVNSACRRRGDDSRLLPSGAPNDAGFHRHDGGCLLADETGILNENRKQASQLPVDEFNNSIALPFI